MNDSDAEPGRGVKRKKPPPPRKSGEKCKCKRGICPSCRTKFFRRKKTLLLKAKTLANEFPEANIMVIIEPPKIKKRRVMCFGSGSYHCAVDKLDDVVTYLDALVEDV